MVSIFEQLVQEIEQLFADDSVEFRIFPGQPPTVDSRLVIFDPGKFTAGPPHRANSGALYAEMLVVDVAHHGVDLADCCDIRIRVSNAIRRVMGASSEPLKGHYVVAATEDAPTDRWTGQSALVQQYVWKIDIPIIDNVYLAEVKQIDVVDRTQITPAFEGVLTPDGTQEIK